MSNTITVSWTIEKAKINTIPTQSGSITYDGSTKVPSWNNYNSNALKITGTTSAVEAGIYNVEFEPTSNYTWWDGSTSKKQASWVLGNATIATLPYQNGICYYTGSAQAPSWNSYNSNALTIGGQTQGTNVNVYTATFTPKVNYQWWDGSTSAKTVSWSIERASISVLPSQNGTLTYNQNLLQPTWNNYNTSQLIIGGITSAKDAGIYVATFTPTTNYQWWDGATNSKTVNWRINKASVTIDVDKTNITLKVGKTDTIRVGWIGGIINQSSFICEGNNHTNISWNGNYLNIQGRSVGIDTLKIYLSESDNYLASSNYKNINVFVDPVWSWGDQTAIGNVEWWNGLSNFIQNSTASEREACIGKTKRMPLTQTWCDTDSVFFVCIDADKDIQKSLTFQALYVPNMEISFSNVSDINSIYYYPNSSLAQEVNKLETCVNSSIKNHIVRVDKGTALNGATDSIAYTSFYFWVTSLAEMGLQRTITRPGNINSVMQSSAQEYTRNVNSSYRYFTDDIRYYKLIDGLSIYSKYWTRSTHENSNTDNPQSIGLITSTQSPPAIGQRCIDTGHIAPCFVYN